MKQGKVYLVGAGPREPDLVTVRAVECLKKADVVIYDFLAAPELLRLVPDGAETIYVGKKGGSHTLSQDRIILTDGRDLDPGEMELVASSRVNHLINPKSLYEYPFPDLPMYIHFDVDIINPLDAPAMSYPAKGGPRASELEDIFRFLAQTLQIVAISLSSWNPELDADGGSKEISMNLLVALLNELQKRHK